MTAAEQRLINGTAKLATPVLFLAHAAAYEYSCTPGLTADGYRAAELVEIAIALELERRGIPVGC